jgi:hypothetical protein
MKRIMFWNIENFSVNKIANPDNVRRQKGSTLTLQAASVERLNYIQGHIVAAQPDILVVVELETTPGGVRGSLAGGNALPACQVLLAMLRSLVGPVGGIGAEWMMVPPLKVGRREAVAVFYRAGTAGAGGTWPNGLFFTGPFVWNGAVAADGAGAAPAAYAGLGYANTLGRNVPAGAQYNPGIREDHCAARVTFTWRDDPAFMLPGEAYDFGAQRSPYMVTFAEMNAAGTAVARNITLFAVHSPAGHNSAPNYLTNVLPALEEVTNGLGATEMRVIAGDFNVNVIHSGDGPADPDQNRYNELYNELCDYDYALALSPNPPHDIVPPVPPLGYRGYFATHMRGMRTASFLSSTGAPQYYPGYNYIGAETGNYFGIDNIYVRYGADVEPPSPNNFTILNGCVGSPYHVVPLPAGEPPRGTVVFASQMEHLAIAAQAADFAIGQRSRLKGWNNFGRIRSTSDHMALVMDI